MDENNQPLRDIILWLDKRQAEFNDPFPFYKKWIFKIAGVEDTTKILISGDRLQLDSAKSAGPLEKNCQVRDAAHLSQLQADRRFGRTRKRTWSGTFRLITNTAFGKTNRSLTKCICDVPNEKLCRLVKSGEVIGHITKAFSERSGVPEGLPLFATGSDKGCENAGAFRRTVKQSRPFVRHDGDHSNGGQKIFRTAKAYAPPTPRFLNDMFNPEIEIYRGFWLLSWFVKEFGAQEQIDAEKEHCSPEQLLDKYIENLPPGCEGLLLQPLLDAGH